MKRLILAALLLAVAGATAPASAQYYGPRGGYDYDDPPPRPRRPPPPDYDYDRPRGGYDRRGGYDGGGGGGRGYGGGGGRGGGSVCVTSRGTCPIGAVVPRNSPCGCDVPGFGYKRGNAG